MPEYDELDEQLREQKNAYGQMPAISSADKIVRFVEKEAKEPRRRRIRAWRVLPYAAAGLFALAIASTLLLSQLQRESAQNRVIDDADRTEYRESAQNQAGESNKQEVFVPQRIPSSIDEARSVLDKMQETGASPSRIDEVFVQFLKDREQLAKNKQPELNEFGGVWHETFDTPEAILEHTEELENAEFRKFVRGVKIQGLSFISREGMLELTIPYDKYQRLFTPYVSDKMDAYLELQASRIILREGSISVTWNAVGNELVHLEQFLTKWPDFPFNIKLKQRYVRDLDLYFNGSIHTFPFKPGTSALKEEVKASYQYVMDTYPNTETASIVKEYFKKLEDNGFQRLESDYMPTSLPEFLKGVSQKRE